MLAMSSCLESEGAPTGGGGRARIFSNSVVWKEEERRRGRRERGGVGLVKRGTRKYEKGSAHICETFVKVAAQRRAH